MLVSLNLIERFIVLPKETEKIEKNGKSFLRTHYNTETIASILTRQGFEVEEISLIGAEYNLVVVGQIEKTERHPSADKLQICYVNVGEEKLRQIVCGGTNARPGLFVACALPGCILPSLGNIEIKANKIRDIESFGMLCARSELGLQQNNSVDGEKTIWEIDQEAQGGLSQEELKQKIGLPVFDVLSIRDCLLNISVTPNRPDMLCHQGVARELKSGFCYASLPVTEKNPHFPSPISLETLISDALSHTEAAIDETKFSVLNELGVSAFFVLLKNIKVTSSPGWLRNILDVLGHNSINNVVDISNFILLTYGQPSHAYDFDKLFSIAPQKKQLTLKFAQQNTLFAGLDGKERSLFATDAIVDDGKEPQALLGVVGGEHSKVTEETTRLVLEFANPHSVQVRRTSRKHGRQTDASFAFEKGIDTCQRWHAANEFIGFLSQSNNAKDLYCNTVGSILQEDRSEIARTFVSQEDLLKKFGPALALKKAVDVSIVTQLSHLKLLQENAWKSFAENLQKEKSIIYTREAQKKILGEEIVPFAQQLNILESLGFSLHKNSDDTVTVQSPSWRWLDVCDEADLVEEFIRVVGIDNINPQPIYSQGVLREDDGHYKFLEKLSSACAALKYHEAMSLHFMRCDDYENLLLPKTATLGDPITLLNPIIGDEPLLHTTLFPDLLRKVAKNLSYGVQSGQLFHSCRTFQNRDILGNVVFSNETKEGNSSVSPTTDNEYSHRYGFAYTREKSQEGRPVETPRLAGVLFGKKHPKTWQNTGPASWSIFDIISHVQTICQSISVEVLYKRPTTSEHNDSCHPMAYALHPGKSVLFYALLGEKQIPLGWAGEVRQKVKRNFEIGGDLFAFELNVANLMLLAKGTAQAKIFHQQKLPSISRDFSFTLEEHVTAQQIKQSVASSLAPLLLKEIPGRLSEVTVFDIFRSEQIGKDKKSVTFNVVIDPTTRTLLDADIQKIYQTVIQGIQSDVKGELRI